MQQDKIYDKIWKKTSPKNPRPFLEYKARLINKFLERKNIQNALDIGCGDGFFTFKLLELEYKVDAIDVSSEAIKSTKERVKTIGMENFVSLYNQDIFEFEPKQKYDIILCLEVLEHVEKDICALKQIKNWLKRDGLLILSVPYRKDLWNYSDDVGGHYRRYSKHELTEKLKIANFEVEEIFDYGFPVIRAFSHGICVPHARKSNSQIISPKSSRLNRTISQILKNLCRIDTFFINSNKGITLISIAKRKE